MENRILGVLGGRDLSGPMFKLWAESATKLLAADSGADFVIEQGLRPHAIVGDMDSVSPSTLTLDIDLYRSDDQNSSDCDKLLQLVQEWGHRSITLIGVEGDRIDHFLGTLHSSVKSPLDVRLAVRDGLGRVMKPGRYRVPATPGRRISLFPLLPSDAVTLTGVRWPLTEITLSTGEFLSLSNEVEEPFVELEFRTGCLLLHQEVPLHHLPLWPDDDGLAILGA